MTTADVFEFPAALGGDFDAEGPQEPGWYPATLRAIQAPKPSQMKNDKGEYPLTSVFEWQLDNFPPDYRKWSYINVQARGEKSKFNEAHMAMFGAPVPRGAFASGGLLGGRCMLNIAPSRNDPEKLVVAGYAKLRQPARRPAPPPPPPDTLTFGDPEDEDAPFD